MPGHDPDKGIPSAPALPPRGQRDVNPLPSSLGCGFHSTADDKQAAGKRVQSLERMPPRELTRLSGLGNASLRAGKA